MVIRSVTSNAYFFGDYGTRTAAMNVLTFASRKGGTGKSTLAAHLAAHVHQLSASCLLIDDDPQSSLTFWNSLRGDGALPLKPVKRTLPRTLRKAERKSTEWMFIDTPANMSAGVVDAIQAATMVIIPCRPGVFDLVAVQETIAFARRLRTPYAVVINGAPSRREGSEAAAVAYTRDCLSRLDVPVWGGQITYRADFSLSLATGQGATEFDASSQAAEEIGRLWGAIEKSVQAIRGARAAAAIHRIAA
jgi:chromosome partitioning protein